MKSMNRHYQQILEKKGKTRFVSCGFEDRFDPFALNKNEKVRKLYRTLFEDFLDDISCKKILDLGCGTGIYFDLLMNYADEVEALDISSDMIHIARAYCKENKIQNIHPRTGSAESLDYKDGLFDTVIAFDLLHHVKRVNSVVHEAHRVLKRGGHFFVFEPNICNPLMFLAHAIPHEERQALRRNRPSRLVAILESRFESVRWQGICALVTQWTGIKEIILDSYLQLNYMVGVKKLFPRQAWLGIKQ